MSWIRSFDHRAAAELPEYRAASQALDALAHALNRAEVELEVPWLDLVREMAAALPFSDGCDQCMHELAEETSFIHAPVAAHVEDGWVKGRYRCGRHGRVWSCGYAAAFPETMEGLR